MKRARRANRTGSVSFAGRLRWIFRMPSGPTRTGFSSREEAERALEAARTAGPSRDGRFRYERPKAPAVAITPADIKWAERQVAVFARRHPHLAEDIRAEAVFSLWLAALDYIPRDEASSLRAFARARVLGSAIDFLRTQNRSVRNAEKRKEPGAAARIVMLDESWWERVPANGQTLDELVDERRRKDRLARLIGRLREREASMLRMYVFDEIPLKEIGRFYGVTESRASQIVAGALRTIAGKKINLRTMVV